MLARKIVALPGSLFLFAAFLVTGSVDVYAQEKPKDATTPQPTIRVIGLEIHKSLSEHEQELMSSEVSGVVVHLLIHFKGRTIIDIGDESSRLLSFSDDKGTDFLKAEKNKVMKPEQWLRRGNSLMKFNRDGYCALRVESPVMPAARASKLLLKGAIGCEVGTTVRTSEWAPSTKKKNTEEKLGPCSVSHTEKQIAFTADKPNRIKDLFYVDGDNTKTKASPSSTGWSGGWVTLGDSSSRCQSFYSYYDIDEKCAKVRIHFYEKHEIVVVPFELEISLGFR